MLDDCRSVPYSPFDATVQLDDVIEVRRREQSDPLTAFQGGHVSELQLPGQHVVQRGRHTEVFTDQLTLNRACVPFVQLFELFIVEPDLETVRHGFACVLTAEFIDATVVQHLDVFVTTLLKVVFIAR
ncbi:hypothetical protein D3C77_562580 [compost metagenome]